MRKLTASDLMTKPVDSLDASTPLTEAIDIFLQKGVARFLVTENGAPVGIISLTDFVNSLTAQIRAHRETVGDVMSHAVLVCREETPVLSATYAMTSSGWRSVMVVDAKGKVLGVLSGYDLLPMIKNRTYDNLTVRDVMHPALTIDINASLREAADMMIKNHHHRLVVIDKENPDAFPIGALSSFDIVYEMARPDSVWQK
jgi:CBS domain-containing protein